MSEPIIQTDFHSGNARRQIFGLLLVGVLLAASLALAIAYRHDAFSKTAERSILRPTRPAACLAARRSP